MVPGGGGPLDPGAALAATVVALGGMIDAAAPEGRVEEAPKPNAAAAVAEVAIGGAATAVEFPMFPTDHCCLSMVMFKPSPPRRQIRGDIR